MFLFDQFTVTVSLSRLVLLWILILGWAYGEIPWWASVVFVLYTNEFVYRFVRPGMRKKVKELIEQQKKMREIALAQLQNSQKKTDEEKKEMI